MTLANALGTTREALNSPALHCRLLRYELKRMGRLRDRRFLRELGDASRESRIFEEFWVALGMLRDLFGLSRGHGCVRRARFSTWKVSEHSRDVSRSLFWGGSLSVPMLRCSESRPRIFAQEHDENCLASLKKTSQDSNRCNS